MSVELMSRIWKNGPTQVHLRMLLLALADHANDEGFCYPSLDRLADKCCTNDRTVRRNLRLLEEDGWLTTEHRPGMQSIYHLSADRLTPVTGDPPVADDPRLPVTGHPGYEQPVTPVTGDPLISKKSSENRTTGATAPALDGMPESVGKPPSKAALMKAGFEEFWSAYPNHNSGRAPAERAYRKALERTMHPELMASLARWKQSEKWREDGGRYVPYATKWLNNGIWQEVPAPAPFKRNPYPVPPEMPGWGFAGA